jgi:hypothetical protein
MRQLTEHDIRRSMVNCSRSETAQMVFPKDFAALDWDNLVYLGWRDPKVPQRGYVAMCRDDKPVGFLLRAADSTMSRRISAMCLLCHSVQSADNISLFTARRAGQAGRDGNTVGTYICADLACSTNLRAGVLPTPSRPDPALVIEQRRDALWARLSAFTDDVLRASSRPAKESP